MLARDAARLVQVAPVFAALGDPTRLTIVGRLSAHGPMSITELTKGGEVSRQAVTKHLQVLIESGLVSDTRRGRERIWELDVRRLVVARRCIEHVSDQWDGALERLRAFIED